MSDDRPDRALAKPSYKFWGTQPQPQFQSDVELDDGPIDKEKTVEDVRKEPYQLLPQFSWCDCDLTDSDTLQEVFDLLRRNYVEDGDQMFRFCYSADFLKWVLCPPGYKVDWHVGVRTKQNDKLVAFITAVPASMCVREKHVSMVEVNFLCIHKKLRTKRLAPILIKEITRRVNLYGIWQAAYTAGVVIPKPVATCRYYHRSLNTKKLLDVGFCRLTERQTTARLTKLNKLPPHPVTPGFREIEERDYAEVSVLLNQHLSQFALRQAFTEDEVRHFLRPCEGLLHAYVVEDEAGNITDMASFYSLPSSILDHALHRELRAAYMYYAAYTVTPWHQLFNDLLIKARDLDYDVFNALNVMHNTDSLLKSLKFGIGDGNLHYYLYNWNVASTLEPSDVALILT